MPQTVKDISFENGFIKITYDQGGSKYLSMASGLKAADIPALTYSQVAAIKTLANLIAILIRTLIDRQVLNESFLEDDDFDLDALIATIEAMGGAYHEPSLSDV